MTIRKATMRDIPGLLDIINSYASTGIMLPRSEFEMAENIRDFLVTENSGGVTGCGALHFYTPVAGEIRSIAVDPLQKGNGLGRMLVEALEAEARQCELEMLFAFTYVPGFFRKSGFLEVDRSELPLKAWKDCMRCPKFQCCDEIAMVKYLDEREAALAAVRREMAAERSDPESLLIQLPVLKR
ncbi:MAG: N-acetyltransferase [Bryobacteraceae bacterium]|nr:N-acetyltransferase [Bryobacteraceae bacterium]